MITWMQKHRKYLVVTIWISTIAFVGAGFVGWGAYNYNTKRSQAVALVGNQKITIKELNTAYSNIFNYYQQKTKGALTNEQAKKLGLQKIALNQLIDEALILNYASELGLKTLNIEVENALENTKAFQHNGVFDKDQYFRVLRNIQITPKDYESSIRKEITLNKINNILHLSPTPLEVKTFGASIFMQDKLMIKIVKANLPNLTVNENELKKFWEKRKESYITKKSYKLSIIKVPVAFIKVDANETKEFYKLHKYSYTGTDGKILSFDAAKNRVIQDLQFKKGKLSALKKYLALRNGKIKATDTIIVKVNNSNFPQKILNRSNIGNILKPFKSNGEYIVAKLDKVNLPRPMTFQNAKNLVKQDYIKVLKDRYLSNSAKQALKAFNDGVNIGFVSRDDIKSVKGLNELEAVEFLNQVFNSSARQGYKIFGNKVIVYKIMEQKLLDKNKLKTYSKLLNDNVKNAKIAEINRKLLSILRNKYKIESFYKGQ